MDDARVLASMRQMAWERAKAELISIQCARYGHDDKSEKFDRKMIDFIEAIEDEGLHE